MLLPGYILFGYFHSVIKVWALLTFWNVKWGSRVLDEGDQENKYPHINEQEEGQDPARGIIEQDWEVRLYQSKR